MAELAKFITAMMKQKKMSEREFAKHIGVAASTLNLHVSEGTRSENDPSLMFLRRLSAGTGIPITRILALAFPDMKEELGLDTQPDELSVNELRLLNAYREWDLATAATLFAERAAEIIAESLGQEAMDAIVKKVRNQ